MSRRLASLAAQVAKDRTAAIARLAEIKVEEVSLKLEVKTLDGCLKYLNDLVKDEDAAPPTRKSSPTQADVWTEVEELLLANGPIDADDLKGLVQGRVSKTKDLKGFELRFGEVRERRLEEVRPGVLGIRNGQSK